MPSTLRSFRYATLSALLLAVLMVLPAIAAGPAAPLDAATLTGFGVPAGPAADGPAPWKAAPEDRVTAEGLPRLDRRPLPAAPRPEGLPIATLEGLSHSGRGRAAGHFLVRFHAGLADWQQEAVAAGLGAAGLTPARHADFARVELAAGETPESAVRRFRDHPSVAWAQVDPLYRAAYTGYAAAPATAAVSSISDPFFEFQWYLDRIGLEEALSRNPRDGQGIVVAVIDSGVAFGNGAAFPARPAPDLAAVSFRPGWDFVDNDPLPYDLGTTSRNPTRDPRFGHGTFVASIIAATVNNGLAGAGVAPLVSVLPVRVLGIDGFGTGSDVAEGIRFAVDNGAHVINLSLGGAGSFEPGADAVRYALANGVVVVAAAGNEADDEEVFADELGSDVAYPARFPEVIAVGATDFENTRAIYSNFGPNLDLMAPAGEDSSRELPGGLRDGVLSTSFLHFPDTGETLYGGFIGNGTSFATPQVAGVAALLMSLGVDDPEVVRTMLRLTARELAGEGFDLTTGHGLLDAASAHRGLGLTH